MSKIASLLLLLGMAVLLIHLGCSRQAPSPTAVDLRVSVSFNPSPVADDLTIAFMQALAYEETEGGDVLVDDDLVPVNPGDTHFSLELVVPPGTYRVEIHALDADKIPVYSGLNHVTVEAGEEVSVSIELNFARPVMPESLSAESEDHLAIDLRWFDPTPENSSMYIIERAQGVPPDPGPWALLDSVTAEGDSVATYTDTPIPNRMPFAYRVRSRNSLGLSPYSGPVKGILFLAPPTNLTAVPVGTDQVDLSWEFPGPDPQHFLLARSLVSDTPALATATLEEVPGDARSYQDLELPRATAFRYLLVAVGFDGESSEESEAIEVTTGDIEAACDVLANLDFGNVSVGQTVQRQVILANTGGMILEGTVALDPCLGFSLVGTGFDYQLASGEADTFTVSFSPPEEGSYQCDLELGSSCGELTATGIGVGMPECDSPDSLIFATPVLVGESTALQATITNNGNGSLDLNVSLAGCGGAFTLISGGGSHSLSPGGFLVVDVQFQPLVDGTVECALNLGSGACEPVILTGTGIGPICSLSETVIDLGEVVQDSVVTGSFTVTNAGGGLLQGGIILGEGCSKFEILSNGGPFSLSADDGPMQVEFNFQSADVGEVECVVLTGLDCTVTLLATVTSAAVCQVSAQEGDFSDYDFGDVEEGQSKTRAIVVTNTGGGLLSGQPSLSGACDAFQILNPGPFNLTAGQSDTIRVRFAPTEPGNNVCSLSLGTDCGAVEITGTGTDAPECLVTALDPLSGATTIGTTLDYRFAFTNTGGGVLVGGLSLADCGEFSVVGSPVYNLEAAESDTITVRFSPTFAGVQACSVLTDCGDFALEGTGEHLTAFTIEPDTLYMSVFFELGSDNEDTASFIITNTGTTTLNGSLSEACSKFKLGPSTYNIGPGGSQEMLVIYQPTNNGVVEECEVVTGLGENVIAIGTATTEANCKVTEKNRDFGLLGMGHTRQEVFSIKNTGGQDLNVDVSLDEGSDSEFSIVSGGGEQSIPAGQFHDFTVEFAPPTDGVPGPKFFTLDFCEITGTGEAAFCKVTPETYDYGPRVVDSWTTRFFEIENISTVEVSGTITPCGPFFIPIEAKPNGGIDYDTFDLVPDETAIFPLTFSPENTVNYNCDVDLGDCGTLTVQGEGVQPPLCALSDTLITLDGYTGAQRSEQFLVWNAGGGILSIDPELDWCEEGIYGTLPTITQGGDPVNLGPGEFHIVEVSYTIQGEDYGSCYLELGAGCSTVEVEIIWYYIGMDSPRDRED